MQIIVKCIIFIILFLFIFLRVNKICYTFAV